MIWRQENKMTSRKVEKLKSEKGTPPLFLPPKGGEIERGEIALSTCQLFNLSTKRNVAVALLCDKFVAADPWSAKWRQDEK